MTDIKQPTSAKATAGRQTTNNEERAKLAKEFQEQMNKSLDEMSKIEDFKEYFKVQRDIIQKYINTWKYIEKNLERDSVEDYRLLLKSFGQMAELDKEKGKISKEKLKTIDKFNKQAVETLEKGDYKKTSEQLFYVLLGNVLEHVNKVDIDMKEFNIQKDLYPHLQMPLGLSFFLFQNLIFGQISQKVNELSKEYLQKYCALLLGLWRMIFELMQYEKQMEVAKKKQAEETEKKEDNNK
ncbi:MAG: hypothetical protein ABIA91_02180 [Patescibacteria group bacterium]